MEQFPKIWDERQTAWCTYCAGDTLTRDHVPSRVLLDEPHPDNLPVVSACERCNVGFSADEEYMACLIECAVAGSVSPSDMSREKIRRILSARPALMARLTLVRSERNGIVRFSPEDQRVKNIILKLARGHALFELNEPQYQSPSNMGFCPLPLLSEEERVRFESSPDTGLLPEVGSRAMQRGINLGTPGFSSEWVVVQKNRYRYLAAITGGLVVRMVLSEYLACEVIWD